MVVQTGPGAESNRRPLATSSREKQRRPVCTRAADSWSSIGGELTMPVVAFAILAPYFSPYGENETAGAPYSKEGLFGTDYLGRTC
jgi:ABC-type dipeptide/oligopeptide/nickel transport system permease subunit